MNAVPVMLSEAMKAMHADPARAAALLRTALQAEPNNLDAGLLLSEALRLNGDFVAAHAVITPLASANPSHFGAQRQLGVVLAVNRAHMPASLALRGAAELNPGHPTIWRDLGDQLALAGDAVSTASAYLRHATSPTMDPSLVKAVIYFALAISKRQRIC
jgi:Flp pilus assembly protein TadD